MMVSVTRICQGIPNTLYGGQFAMQQQRPQQYAPPIAYSMPQGYQQPQYMQQVCIFYISAVLSHVLIDTVLKLLSCNFLYSYRRNMYNHSKLLLLLLLLLLLPLYLNKLRHGLSIQLMVCCCILVYEERRCVHYMCIYLCVLT